jgi:threonylcarbamoyladenosine tRNA methylthiotransferase MtaB
VLAHIEGVDLIIGNQEKLNVLDYVAAGKNETPLLIQDRMDRTDFSIDLPAEQDLTSPLLTRRANLKIQDGCDFMCSFCIIAFARGRSRSRAMDNLLQEARRLVDRGAKELVLTGVNIGDYDFEGNTLVEVVDKLNTLDGLQRIRISSIELTTIPEVLLERMANPDHALVPYLHVPLQSGSDRILKAMGRHYTREEFSAFLSKAHAEVPGLGLGTDIMVGFPGETDQDFEDTYALLEDSPLFYAHVFKYSERQGTASVRIPEKIDSKIAKLRSARLHKLSAAKTRQMCRSHLDGEEPVLFEQQQHGYWTGYTGNYLRVGVCSEERLDNQIRTVLLEDLGPDIMYGKLTEARLDA